MSNRLAEATRAPDPSSGRKGAARQTRHTPASNALKDLSIEAAEGPAAERIAQAQSAEANREKNQSAHDSGALVDEIYEDESEATGLRRVPIPASYWNSIPADCLRRMFEFDSVLEEYAATFGNPPAPAQFDDSPRLALEDIMDLTLLNSREYQAQKEALYRVALALSLERFDYELKPSVGGNGTASNFTHNRSGGDTVDTLRIPTGFQLDKMLYTGGDLLARFANSVVLTFNGPSGFAADVGSELFFDVFQSVHQRDVRLENLTQSERNVVYAARDFARFRKELFVEQASQYYSLIQVFRQVEINSQSYFMLVREFNQREVEYRGGFTRRNDVDQVEQQLIGARRAVLNACIALDNSLDRLKIRIGVPTEQPMKLDLSELNLLTLRDELAVNAKLIERVQNRILQEKRAETPARATLLSTGGALVERMLDSIQLRERLGEDPPEAALLEEQQILLRVETAELNVAEAKAELDSELNESPTLTIIFQRRTDLTDELLEKIRVQIELLSRLTDDTKIIENERVQFQELRRQKNQLRDSFEQLVFEEKLELLPQLVADTETLQRDLESKSSALDLAIGRDDVPTTPEAILQRTIEQVDQLLRQSDAFLRSSERGLVPVRIDMDEAMMTALVQRLDLMNERGFLADDWRQIKIAADDLKSVLNLRASQTIRNRNGRNEPFDFTSDDSTTALSASLDLPFNRRAQRNRFRSSLFDYQAALRRLTLLEDNIKLSVRQDLRQLALDREQYVNDITSAALAFERVVSTELEVRLGNLTSRDFLESQQAYIQALSGVAAQHIGYITNRLGLFLDLESLTVDDDGFWDQLYNEQHHPAAVSQLPGYARPAYGHLHPHLKYSHKIKRMLCVPTGTSMIHAHAGSGDTVNDESVDVEPPLPFEAIRE